MPKINFLTNEDVKRNIKNIQQFLAQNKSDALFINTGDNFLNEYVPLEDCFRYYVTNFTGSTALTIVPQKGKVLLFVDGRYFEQADNEVDLDFVKVLKVDMSMGLTGAMLATVADFKWRKLTTAGDRIDLELYSKLSNVTTVHLLKKGEVSQLVQARPLQFDKKIHQISPELTGETTISKLQRILKPGEAFYLTALDSIAWLTNLRRYEFPNQSIFRAKALLTFDRVYLLMEELEGEITTPEIEVYLGKFHDLESFFQDLFFTHALVTGEKLKLSKIFYSENTITAQDFDVLKMIFGASNLENKKAGLIPYQSIKNPQELQTIKDSFELADQAIWKTLNWLKQAIKNNETVSEYDYFLKCNEHYKELGAFDQSFGTIAGVGPNSSIIHYGSPDKNLQIKAGELALLDSGGLFAAGYATDTTRTILTGGVATPKQKEIYTLVLKSILWAMNLVFPEDMVGAGIDAIARAPMLNKGFNYNHGTGHGVGVNVHEGGFRISPMAFMPLNEGSVGSIEPGIYLPGMGGVRLENIVVVKRHPHYEKMFMFESLVYIGFDPELIDFSMLTEIEKEWLSSYEQECAKRSRSFMN